MQVEINASYSFGSVGGADECRSTPVPHTMLLGSQTNGDKHQFYMQRSYGHKQVQIIATFWYSAVRGANKRRSAQVPRILHSIKSIYKVIPLYRPCRQSCKHMEINVSSSNVACSEEHQNGDSYTITLVVHTIRD
jgi:hypothetical protein